MGRRQHGVVNHGQFDEAVAVRLKGPHPEPVRGRDVTRGEVASAERPLDAEFVNGTQQEHVGRELCPHATDVVNLCVLKHGRHQRRRDVGVEVDGVAQRRASLVHHSPEHDEILERGACRGEQLTVERHPEVVADVIEALLHLPPRLGETVDVDGGADGDDVDGRHAPLHLHGGQEPGQLHHR